jgi:hypothetical protein
VNIRELREKLAEYPDDMEVLICHDDDCRYGGNGSDIDEFTVQTQTIGICNPTPTVYDALVLDTSCCGI